MQKPSIAHSAREGVKDGWAELKRSSLGMAWSAGYVGIILIPAATVLIIAAAIAFLINN